MTLQDVVNLIQLRRFLHDVQNGYSVLSKEQLRGINAKLRELDNTIVKNALSSNLTMSSSMQVVSTESDFEASTELVLKSRNASVAISKAGVDIENQGGVTVASAPPDAEADKPAPKKKRGAFSRTEE